MTLNNLLKGPTSRTKIGYGSGIVVNGYVNLVSGVDADARRIVEAKYADQWNAAGWVRRRELQRIMNAEMKECAGKLMPKVSPKSMF